uniref:Uncharacterized protein n=1 Tax=viral metagenome TaxID=1070528 RepID=A0A6M3JP41_9ZZZZ
MLYKGSFNYYGQLFNLFRTTSNINRAFFYMTRKIALEANVNHSTVKYYFGGMRDNFHITELKEG